MNLLDIKDVTEDLPTYGATLKLEETVEKMLGMENRIGKCGWDSAYFCRDEELVRYLTIVGQLQFELEKIYKD